MEEWKSICTFSKLQRREAMHHFTDFDLLCLGSSELHYPSMTSCNLERPCFLAAELWVAKQLFGIKDERCTGTEECYFNAALSYVSIGSWSQPLSKITFLMATKNLMATVTRHKNNPPPLWFCICLQELNMKAVRKFYCHLATLTFMDSSTYNTLKLFLTYF